MWQGYINRKGKGNPGFWDRESDTRDCVRLSKGYIVREVKGLGTGWDRERKGDKRDCDWTALGGA